jgi:SAM-dependent methyltransferase
MADGCDGAMQMVTPACKICGAPTVVAFSLPVAKKTGHPIPAAPDDCPYFECERCRFCFSTHLDAADHTEVYDEDYWNNQDPDWYGRVSETLRLVLLANSLLCRPPYELEILDFGCGIGGFVEMSRRSLQLDVWGTDIVPPKVGRERFLPVVDRQFDVIVTCEVLEHVPTPSATFRQLRSWLKPGGVLAFQTAEYDPNGEGRDWWYVGPDNGHISLYSRGALDHLYAELGGARRTAWRNYAGVQAWAFE